jgi:hypothetical protein
MADEVGANWQEVSELEVTVGTMLAVMAPKVKWTPELVRHLLRHIRLSGYDITKRPAPVAQEDTNGSL